MDIDMVTFTGSTDTGRRFLHYSADSNIKEVVLELGGKNPCIVLDDAEDLDKVAAQIVAAAFWNMGENCSAGSRLIVQEGIKDKLMERVLHHSKDWKTTILNMAWRPRYSLRMARHPCVRLRHCVQAPLLLIALVKAMCLHPLVATNSQASVDATNQFMHMISSPS
jgi:hypothetical protein